MRNEYVKRKTEVERKLYGRMDQRLLSVNGHMVRMNEERMTKTVCKVDVSEVSERKA